MPYQFHTIIRWQTIRCSFDEGHVNDLCVTIDYLKPKNFDNQLILVFGVCAMILPIIKGDCDPCVNII